MSLRDGSSAVWHDHSPRRFRHQALFYAGEEEFVTATSSFIRDGLVAGQPTMVAILPGKIDRLRTELGRDADRVSFVDMAEVGRNPAHIIPEWQQFVDSARPGVALRGVGEPIWSARGPDELVESQLHEKLLNIAFSDSPALWLLCPYDTGELGPAIIEEARRSHPFLLRNRRSEVSPDYRDLTETDEVLTDALPPPPGHPRELTFETDQLAVVRADIAAEAAEAGLSPSRAHDLVVAVNEISTNSVRHGGGRGVLRTWHEAGSLVCEVTDKGQIRQPLAGRSRPGIQQKGQRGLWLANQLCDLVQVRSSRSGTTVRVHMRLA